MESASGATLASPAVLASRIDVRKGIHVAEEIRPGLDEWLAEAKRDAAAADVGMYLVHNGVVRSYSRDGRPVVGMELSVDRSRLEEALAVARGMEGVSVVRAWVNEGELAVGDDIMYALVGGDIREHVFAALQALVSAIKSDVVTELEKRP